MATQYDNPLAEPSETITLEEYRRNLERDKDLPVPVQLHRRGHAQEVA